MANQFSINMSAGMVAPPSADAVTKVRDVSSSQQGATAARESTGQAKDQARSIDDVVSGLNEMVQNLHRHLQFSVDEDSGDTVIKVIDSDTQQVVRQIPSEEIVRLHQRLKDAAGALFRGAV
jgi:flagellar protein FlaG